MVRNILIQLFLRQDSVAGSVNQAIGLLDIEDGPKIGNQSEAGNSLQRVHTKPEINATIVPGGRVDQVPAGAEERPTCQVLRNQWY